MSLMIATDDSPADAILREASQAVQRDGYAIINLSSHMRYPAQLRSFQKSWDNLIQDQYLPKRFGLRFRRHGRFLYNQGLFTLLPPAPYFQSEEVNPVAGGMRREFAPLEDSAASSSILRDCLQCGAEIFPLHECARWIINVHCVRIPCSVSMVGCPCPEGRHKDGFEFISIHVMQRKNIIGAVTSLYDAAENLLATCELNNPLDSVFASDIKVQHYTDTFEAVGTDRGYRDTLLVSYEREL